jgi:hypothetical protein
MELALYAPGLGYYSGGAHKFGAAGDFVTAPEMSPPSPRRWRRRPSRSWPLARRESSRSAPAPAASPPTCCSNSNRRNALPERYGILDLSGELRERQHATIAQRARICSTAWNGSTACPSNSTVWCCQRTARCAARASRALGAMTAFSSAASVRRGRRVRWVDRPAAGPCWSSAQKLADGQRFPPAI